MIKKAPEHSKNRFPNLCYFQLHARQVKSAGASETALWVRSILFLLGANEDRLIQELTLGHLPCLMSERQSRLAIVFR